MLAEKVRQRAFTFSWCIERGGQQESFSQAVDDKEFWSCALLTGLFQDCLFDIEGKANVHEFFLSVQIYQTPIRLRYAQLCQRLDIMTSAGSG